MIDYFNLHYRPDQLVVSVAGDVSHEAIKRKLRPLLSRSWPGRKKVNSDWLPPHSNIPDLNHGFWWAQRPTEQVHLIWGVRGPHYQSQDRFAAFLLNVYLGGGMSSSLFQEIREKNGLAYSVYSNLSPFVDSGIFSIYAATGMEQVPLCLRLIEKCVQQVKTKLLPRKELRMIQDNLIGTILLSSDSVESRMTNIAKNDIFLGKYVPLEESCKRILAVRPEDIKRMALELFQDHHRCVFALGPKPSPRLGKVFTGRFRPELLSG
jgi:predicted Zn-dependent peptidase